MEYLLLILGALLFLGFKFMFAIVKTEFKPSIFVKKNLPPALLNVLMGVILILGGIVIPFEYGGVDFGTVSQAVIGFIGTYLLRKALKKAFPDFEESLSK